MGVDAQVAFELKGAPATPKTLKIIKKVNGMANPPMHERSDGHIIWKDGLLGSILFIHNEFVARLTLVPCKLHPSDVGGINMFTYELGFIELSGWLQKVRVVDLEVPNWNWDVSFYTKVKPYNGGNLAFL